MSVPRDPGGNPRAPKLVRPKVKPPKPPRPTGVFAEPTLRNPVERMQTTQARHTARAILDVTHQAPARPLTRAEVVKAYNSPVGKQVQVHEQLAARADAIKQEMDRENAADKPGGYSPLALVRIPTGTEVSDYWRNVLADQRAGLPGPLRAASDIGLNVIKEAIDIPAQAIPSTAKLAGDIVTHPERAVVDDLAKPTLEVLKHPTQHPLSLVLIGSGAESALGRTAGATARSGLLGATLKDVAATDRAPIELTGALTEPRSYSKDVIAKGVQVARERRQVSQGIDPNKATGKQLGRALRRRVDESVDLNEGLRRSNRDRTAAAQSDAQPKHGKEAVPLIVEGTVRSRATVRPDLEAELQRLQDAAPKLEATGDVKQNAAQQDQVRGLLANKKFLADPAPAFDAAKAYIDAHGAASDRLVQLGYLTAEQADRAKLVPYAIRHMGAQWDAEARDLTLHGEPLTNEQIRAHMQGSDSHPALELGDVGFMTHRHSPRNAYYIPTDSRPIHYGTRSGKAVEQGTYDASPDALTHQAVRTQGLVDAIEGVNRTINEFGMKKSPDHYFKNWEEARRYAEEVQAHGGPNLVPFRIAPFQSSRLIVKDGEAFHVPGHTPNIGAIKEGLSPESIQQHFEQLPQRLRDAANDGNGEAVLIPRSVHQRLIEHADTTNSTTFDKAFQVATGQFRQTVLPLSVRWLFGNVAEAGMRLASVGAFSPRAGARVLAALREADPAAAAEFEARALSGTHFSAAKRQQLHRSAEQFNDTALEGVAHAAGKVAETAPARAMLKGWRAYRDDVAFKANKWFEQQTQKAAIGKLARDQIREMGHSWIEALRMGDGALEDLTKGLQNTDRQVQYARYVDRVLGRYSKLGPTERRIMSDYAPFAAWYRNALAFIGRLPVDHPIKTAGLAEAYNASSEYRKQNGLGEFLPGGVPRFLQGSLPLDGGKVRLEAYTPFGAVSDPLGTPADLILPQGRTILNAAQGKDWKGDSLSKGGGNPQLATEAKAILAALGSGFIPGVTAVSTIRGKGGEAFANPLKVVRRKGASTWGSAGGSGSSGGWGSAAGPTAAEILGSSGGPSVSDILGSTP